MTVAKMPRVSVLQDGTAIELVFADALGKSVTLRFSPEMLNQFVARAVQTNMAARNQKQAMSGHLEVQAVPVVAATAQSPVGGGRVILLLRDPDGIVASFSLPLSGIDQLRSEIDTATKQARKEGGQTRQ
jgi:hypothetical protein